MHAILGEDMTGGEIVVEGSVQITVQRGLVGYRQKGGRILVKGDVHGSIGCDSYSGAYIEVGGNVEGEVGGNDAAGLEVTVHGNVHGRVGCSTKDMQCTIRGCVHGEVARFFGSENPKHRKRDGFIEIFGDVHGSVGDLMHEGSEVLIHGNVKGDVGNLEGGIVRVDGEISRVIPSMGGEIYSRGRRVTKRPTAALLLRSLGRTISNLFDRIP